MSKKTTTSKSQPEAPDFETSVAQVEALIDQIEQGEIGLEASVEAYEKGVKLIGRCRSILDTAEQKIIELTENADSSGSGSSGEKA